MAATTGDTTLSITSPMWPMPCQYDCHYPPDDAFLSVPNSMQPQQLATRRDMKLNIGEAYRRVSYATSIHHLTEPIDIYGEWLDECERVNCGEDNSRKRPCIA
ncbi:putative Transcription elongation factor 1 [Cocos nucifera]|nr:putative Transcription elongation factor 1 [Cocos nucifera]